MESACAPIKLQVEAICIETGPTYSERRASVTVNKFHNFVITKGDIYSKVPPSFCALGSARLTIHNDRTMFSSSNVDTTDQARFGSCSVVDYAYATHSRDPSERKPGNLLLPACKHTWWRKDFHLRLSCISTGWFHQSTVFLCCKQSCNPRSWIVLVIGPVLYVSVCLDMSAYVTPAPLPPISQGWPLTPTSFSNIQLVSFSISSVTWVNPVEEPWISKPCNRSRPIPFVSATEQVA